MTDTIKISRDELQRIAQGCSCEVTTDALDALLATPPADAADMGGQVVYRCHKCKSVTPPPAPYTAYVKCQCGEWTAASAAMAMGGQAGEEVVVVAHLMRPDFMEPYVSIRRDCSGVFVEQLMTVAQHRRILAQHRQQTGKLVEALRAVIAYDEMTEDDEGSLMMHYSEMLRLTREALADWEKTNGQ